MKSERITFRIDENLKNKIITHVKKEDLKLSEYIISCINEKLQTDDLTDSQGQFLKLFDTAYERSSSSNFKRLMVVLNKINFNTTLLIKALDTYMKQLKIPQNRDDVITTFVSHPIISIAEEQTLKELRNAKQKKEDVENSNE